MFDEETTTVEADELTACCHALTTFHDLMECCKVCFREVINSEPPAMEVRLDVSHER